MAVPPLKGKLLVAAPPLADDNFDRTVVLMLEHSDEGALGIVLNRPTNHAVADALPEWSDRCPEPAVLFTGGPVEDTAVIALAVGAAGEPTDGFAPLLGLIGTVDLEQDAALVLPQLSSLRVFVGYAGWVGGQIEDELEAGAWIVADRADRDPFTDHPESLWRTVLGRQHGPLAWLAHFPDDPSAN